MDAAAGDGQHAKVTERYLTSITSCTGELALLLPIHQTVTITAGDMAPLLMVTMLCEMLVSKF